jgi:hypothetical protein
MRRRDWLLALILSALACHDSSPTSPVLQSAPIPDVAGAWTGTVKTLEVLGDGDNGALCPAEPVSVEIERTSGLNSRFFHASIQANCVTANFNGQFVAPANQTLNGMVTYDVNGVTYQAVLNAALEGGSSRRMSATTSAFQHPLADGGVLLRDSLRFELSR